MNIDELYDLYVVRTDGTSDWYSLSIWAIGENAIYGGQWLDKRNEDRFTLQLHRGEVAELQRSMHNGKVTKLLGPSARSRSADRSCAASGPTCKKVLPATRPLPTWTTGRVWVEQGILHGNIDGVFGAKSNSRQIHHGPKIKPFWQLGCQIKAIPADSLQKKSKNF